MIIAADPTKLLDHEIGTLADYIAMLALTQLSSLDVCQNLASVTSLLTPGCASSAQALTVNDRGYLRGLYHMNPERALEPAGRPHRLADQSGSRRQRILTRAVSWRDCGGAGRGLPSVPMPGVGHAQTGCRACALDRRRGFAVAQTPTTESVTVTQTREAIAKFIQTFAKPTRLTGKLARWETPICPVTMGVKDEANEFVTRRVREVAGEVGRAGGGARKVQAQYRSILHCKAPQALMEDIRQNYSGYVGYYDSRDERDRLTTFAHPIQALYSTATARSARPDQYRYRPAARGARGDDHSSLHDDGRGRHGRLVFVRFRLRGALVRGMTPKLCTRYMPNAIKANVTGSRIGDGLRSSFEHVIIVVDPRLVAGQELGAVSDYIAMLALTQITPPDGCVSLPSVANLLAPGCGEPVKGLTPGDMAYLRGLYRMDASAFLGGQKAPSAGKWSRLWGNENEKTTCVGSVYSRYGHGHGPGTRAHRQCDRIGHQGRAGCHAVCGSLGHAHAHDRQDGALGNADLSGDAGHQAGRRRSYAEAAEAKCRRGWGAGERQERLRRQYRDHLHRLSARRDGSGEGDQPDLLGYADSSEERDRLATVKRPIQAWYRTATQDLRGHTFVDGSRTTDTGRGVTAVLPCTYTSQNKRLTVVNGMAVFQGVGHMHARNHLCHQGQHAGLCAAGRLAQPVRPHLHRGGFGKSGEDEGRCRHRLHLDGGAGAVVVAGNLPGLAQHHQ